MKTKKGVYLSQATREVDFKYGKFNHINANVGSGKTTYVGSKLEKDLESIYGKKDGLTILLAPYNMLEDQVEEEGLFDKVTDNHLLAMKGFVFYEDLSMEDLEQLKTDKIVMTPHRLLRLMEHNDSLLDDVKLIIFDESDHTLLKLPQWERIANRQRDTNVSLFNDIVNVTKNMLDDTMVVSISATGKQGLEKAFNGCYNEITFKEKLRAYTPKSVKEYSNIQAAMSEVDIGKGKAAIYMESVRAMKTQKEYLEGLGYRVDMIVSDHAKNYKMNNREKAIKKDLSKASGVSDKIGDVLIFNAAMERGVSINDKSFHSVIVHSSDKDTQTQVIGRFRFSGMKVWQLKDTTKRVRADRVNVVIDSQGRISRDIVIPNEWLDIPLTTQGKKDLIKAIGYNKTWRGLKPELIKRGYNIQDTRRTIDGKRPKVSIITKTED